MYKPEPPNAPCVAGRFFTSLFSFRRSIMVLLSCAMYVVYAVLRLMVVTVWELPAYFRRYWIELLSEIAIGFIASCGFVIISLLVCEKYPWHYCQRVSSIGLIVSVMCGFAFMSPVSKQWKDAPKEIIIIAMMSYVPFVGQMLFAVLI